MAPLTHPDQVQVQVHHSSSAKPLRTRLARLRSDRLPAPPQPNLKSHHPYHSLHVQAPSLMSSRRLSGPTPVGLVVVPARNSTSPSRRRRQTMRIPAGPTRHLPPPANPGVPTPQAIQTAAPSVAVRIVGTLFFHLQARVRRLFSLPALLDLATRSRARRLQFPIRTRMHTIRTVKGLVKQVALLVEGRARATALKRPSAHYHRGI